MNIISTRTASVALHSIVNSASAQGRREFSIRDLMQSWSRTGLRNSDLGIALSDASNRRCVKLEVKPDGPMSVVLDKSFGLDTQSIEFNKELKTLATLRKTRAVTARAGEKAESVGAGRRIEDADNDPEFHQQA